MSVCVYGCVCVRVRLEVNTSNEQLFHEQHGKMMDHCFPLGSSVFIIFSLMNMYYFGNLK